MEKAECSIECSDTLFEVSSKRLADYWECEGDSVLNWKDRGYKTLFDLLMVLLTDYSTILNTFILILMH